LCVAVFGVDIFSWDANDNYNSAPSRTECEIISKHFHPGILVNVGEDIRVWTGLRVRAGWFGLLVACVRQCD
jgi:hypothetical protein